MTKGAETRLRTPEHSHSYFIHAQSHPDTCPEEPQLPTTRYGPLVRETFGTLTQ
jgi:hypothetical protein